MDGPLPTLRAELFFWPSEGLGEKEPLPWNGRFLWRNRLQLFGGKSRDKPVPKPVIPDVRHIQVIWWRHEEAWAQKF